MEEVVDSLEILLQRDWRTEVKGPTSSLKDRLIRWV